MNPKPGDYSSIDLKISVGRGEWDCYNVSGIVFPGGEVQTRVEGLPERITGNLQVIARIQSSDALLRLLMLDEILARTPVAGITELLLPYMPYARQDRVMLPHESFSLRALTRIFNDCLVYDQITVLDPHSDVTVAHLMRGKVVSQREIINQFSAVCELLAQDDVVVVSPDAGAVKKADLVATEFDRALVVARKTRDAATGRLSDPHINNPAQLVGKRALIVDDICDGGRTFIQLAQALRLAGATHVYLYVTHGIFSQGLDVFDGLIDGLFATDSFHSEAIINADSSRVPLIVVRVEDVLSKGGI